MSNVKLNKNLLLNFYIGIMCHTPFCKDAGRNRFTVDVSCCLWVVLTFVILLGIVIQSKRNIKWHTKDHRKFKRWWYNLSTLSSDIYKPDRAYKFGYTRTWIFVWRVTSLVSTSIWTWYWMMPKNFTCEQKTGSLWVDWCWRVTILRSSRMSILKHWLQREYSEEWNFNLSPLW